jgi:RNA polymerase sigma factor (sigma-70 family)
LIKIKNYPAATEIEQLFKTNVVRDTKVENELVEKLECIVDSAIDKYRHNPNFHDIRSRALYVLFKAIRSFDHKKCNNFRLWVWRWLSKDLAIAGRVERQRSFNFVCSGLAKEMEGIATASGNIEQELLFKEQLSLLRKNLHKLSHPKSQIMYARYGFLNEKKSIKEVAEELQISPSAVFRMEKEAIRELRDYMIGCQ